MTPTDLLHKAQAELPDLDFIDAFDVVGIPQASGSKARANYNARTELYRVSLKRPDLGQSFQGVGPSLVEAREDAERAVLEWQQRQETP